MTFARSPSTAAVLSFVLPGLGQLSLGSRRRGLMLVTPAALVFAAIAGLLLAGRGAVLDAILRPEILAAVLVANLVLCPYHLIAIADAYQLARPSRVVARRARRLSALVVTVALLVTLAVHGAVEAVAYQAFETLEAVFVPGEPGGAWSIPEPSFEPEPSAEPSATATAQPSPSATSASSGAPSPSPSASASVPPSPTPSATPRWATNGRLDLLLIGGDAGPDRWSLRTDTILVLSVDVRTGRAALFGIPRNLVGVPLPAESADAFEGGRFPGLLNALYVYAMGHPGQFPGGDARGFRAVSGAIQELAGVKLDGVVVVNLAGFVRLVNALGGLWIDVPEQVVDRAYPLEDGSGLIRLDIRPGCQHLDGRMTLAYARSRHQDSDYGRMRRQQAVLVALARQVDPIALIPKVPDLLRIAKDNLWTTVKRADVRGLAELAARVHADRITTVRFVPPSYASNLDRAEIARIRKVVRTVFAGAAPSGPSGGSAPRACP